jgi:hypothetical protein
LLFLALAGSLKAQQQPAPSQTASTKDSDEDLALAKQLAEAGGDEAGSATGAASTNGEGPAGIVPLNNGFNASLGITSQHDSAAGWSNIINPNVAWRFGPHFSINAGLPIYAYLNVAYVTSEDVELGQVISATYGLRTAHTLLGDTTISAEFEAHPRPFDYNVFVILGTPTGDNANGLGAGQVTYAFNNHFEHPLTDWLIPELELGIGNSTNLDNSRVRKSYTDVGTNAHFQLGVGFGLPFHSSFTTDAYEELPITTQTVTSVTTNGKKGKQLKLITTSKDKSVGEDNGFLNTLDIPLTGHITLSGFYNRSLRDKDDTAGFSFTLLLRPTPHGKDETQ